MIETCHLKNADINIQSRLNGSKENPTFFNSSNNNNNNNNNFLPPRPPSSAPPSPPKQDHFFQPSFPLQQTTPKQNFLDQHQEYRTRHQHCCLRLIIVF